MLKKTETIGFFVTFLGLATFQLGGRAPLAPSWLYLCSQASKVVNICFTLPDGKVLEKDNFEP